jgi:APA family basic amino acid/polyamine antiporter
VMVILMGVILTAGLRTTFAFQNTFWIIASVGTFIAFAVLLIGTNTDFVNNFNEMNAKFGGGTAQDVINAAGVAGVTPDPTKLDATLPTVFIVMTFMMWNWWSVYLSGELKTASNRRRQLSIMFGALAWDVLFIALGALLLFKVTGYDFMVAVNTGGNAAYALPTGPWYHFMASLVYAAPALTFIIVGSFLFWSLPAMVGNTFMPIRTMFAWSFDRLLPEKLSEVNERTHSPVWAIWVEMVIITAMLIWSIATTDFITWLTLGVLAGVVTVIIVAIAALAFPSRRPDLYQASPANAKFLGIPVLYIVAPLSILCMLFLVWCTVAYPALVMMGNTANIWWIPAFIGMIIVVGLVVYFGAKFIRRSQGVDIDLVYKELPPE